MFRFEVYLVGRPLLAARATLASYMPDCVTSNAQPTKLSVSMYSVPGERSGLEQFMPIRQTLNSAQPQSEALILRRKGIN